MRKVISKKLKKPSLKELKKQLTDAVINLSKSFQADSNMDVATAEANIRMIEQKIKDCINGDPALKKKKEESEVAWTSLVEEIESAAKIEDPDKKDQ